MNTRIAKKIARRITNYIDDWEYGYLSDSLDKNTGDYKYPFPIIYKESLRLVCKKFKYTPEQVDAALKKTYKTGVYRGIYRQIFYPCDECWALGCQDEWAPGTLPEDVKFCGYVCCYYCGQCDKRNDDYTR